jgi:hypothetical protein
VQRRVHREAPPVLLLGFGHRPGSGTDYSADVRAVPLSRPASVAVSGGTRNVAPRQLATAVANCSTMPESPSATESRGNSTAIVIAPKCAVRSLTSGSCDGEFYEGSFRSHLG